ncbi:MAG: ribosomal protein [Candidatus Parcubacteria bacterium]|jgi:large subunit ribosomal protein L24
MIKKGQTVKILCGDDKGKTGTVVKVLPLINKLIVEGINVKKSHVKKTASKKGEIIELATPIHISNVAAIK